MDISNSSHTNKSTPPPHLLPVIRLLKDAYLIWNSYLKSIPKTNRYSLGLKIDMLFIDSIEAAVTAAFLKPGEKLPYIYRSIQKLDTLKVLLMVLWEIKSLDNKRYILLSEKLDELGRMLGGWCGQQIKNSLNNQREKRK